MIMLTLNKARAPRAATFHTINASKQAREITLNNSSVYKTSLADIVSVESSLRGEAILVAVKTVDSVHRAHPLPVLPVLDLPIRFRPLTNSLGEFFYSPYGDLVCSVEVDTENDRFAFTVVHELGHFLDILWLGDRSSKCEDDPQFEGWREAVMGTKAFERLDALAYEEAVLVSYPYQEPLELRPDAEIRDHARYLLSWKELWARSYAQYIAVRSEEPILVDQLRREIESHVWPLYHQQWEEDDFASIADAMDDLFEALE